jgi:hypothetical protein
LLELGNRISEASGQAGEFGGAGEDAESGEAVAEDSLDNHCAAEARNSGSGGVFAEDEKNQAVEREDMQTIVTSNSRVA